MKTSMMAVFAVAGISMVSAASSQAATANPWLKYVGCYDTISRNGDPVVKPDKWDIGAVTSSASFFTDMDGKKLNGVNFTIFQKFSAVDNTSYYDLLTAFDDRGVYNHDSKGDHYAFSGQLKVDGTPFTVVETVDIVETSRDTLQLHGTIKVPGTDGSFDEDNAYVLKQTACNGPNP